MKTKQMLRDKLAIVCEQNKIMRKALESIRDSGGSLALYADRQLEKVDKVREYKEGRDE